MSQQSASEHRIPVIGGYHLANLIYAGNRTLVYRGTRLSDGQPVVLKLRQGDLPSLADLLRLRNHYAITQHLNSPGVVQPLSLDLYGNGYVLVMPDEQYGALSDFVGAQPLDLRLFFAIALQLCDILYGLYQHRIIHKDIKPANILIHPETWQVKLNDFSIASRLPKETQELQTPYGLEGTFAYLSPEQTGRMNRGIDYRSDFYALGVTFYELLTGELPFLTSDPLELVHCHLAIQPPSAHTVNADIPPILSHIITKLMAKNAEDRYQSALGLKYDLQRCWQLWPEQGQRIWFTLAERDVCDRFLISERIYGRDAEVMELLSAFNRASIGATELLLVCGFSGVGKTAVVNEVHKPIVRQRGYFIKGKFDQFNRNVPFSAFVQALGALVHQLLSEPDAQLHCWKTKILEALGDNAKVITDVIPHLERIIGVQPPVPVLAGLAAQNRFNVLFEKFIAVFTTPEHPLVMFLDDLQWADVASLNLIQLLMGESQLGYLLLIGAYRDNEVSAVHPLMLALANIRQTSATVSTMALTPLSHQSLSQLVADTLSCSIQLAHPLADQIYQKTQGNPFFATQFLKALHHDGWITFDLQSGYWQCDIARVRTAALTDDVVAFMALQLQKLPLATQRVLQLAACIGNQFDLATLRVAQEVSAENTAADLWRALQEGFVLPTSEIYKFFQEKSIVQQQESAQPLAYEQPVGIGPLAPETCSYRFLHDRVQQAAYSLIPEAERAAIHLKIGQLLLRQDEEASNQADDRLFEIVNQLNYGSALLTTQVERHQLAQLNQRAGAKAKAATAYAAALGYFTAGLKLLAPEVWQQNYELALKLYESAAEAAYLSGHLDQVEPFTQVVLLQARKAADKTLAYQIKILTVSAQAQLLQGVQLGLQALADLGMDLPETVEPQVIDQAFQAVAAQLAQRTPQDLLTLPQMTDDAALAAMKILTDMNNLAYQSAPQLLPLIMLKQVSLSLQYGNSADSALAYAGYGFTLLNVMGEIEAGYAFGQLALQVLDHLEATAIRGKLGFLTTVWFTHWKQSAQVGLQPALDGYQAALLAGDLEFAALCLFLHSYTSYHVGRELATLQQEMAHHHQAIMGLKQEGSLRLHQLHEQLVANLRSKSLDVRCLQGDYYDEQEQLAIHYSRNERSLLCHLFSNKLMLGYWFGDYAIAAENALKANDYLDGLPSTLTIALISWYDALTLLALYPQVDEAEQILWMERIIAQQSKLQTWATHAPANFLHKWLLVEAERHRVLGDYVEAMDAYDRAIALASENGYTHEAALAHEVATRFYLGWGKTTIARAYLTQAYYGYARWGAIAKVRDLEVRYPQLLSPILEQATPAFSAQDTLVLPETSGSVSTVLDLATILQVSQTLSREIEWDHLLPTLIQLVITNAGADKAALLLNQGGRLELAIQYFNHQVHLPTSQSVEQCDQISIPLVRYVERTLETVMTDWQTHAITLNDPYCLRAQPNSLLCTPILNQGKLVAILYLENAITAHAFTDDRVEILNLLCAQAAIALENAQLYQKSQSYACQLEDSLAQLQVSEIRFKHLAANIPGMIFQLHMAVDGRTSVSYASSGCYDLCEVSAEAMMAGQYTFRDFEHVDDRSAIDQQLAQCALTLQPFHLEFRIITPSNHLKWIQVVAQPVRQADGSTLWDGLVVDISDRKQLEQYQERLLSILEASSDFIGTANPDGQVTWFNGRLRHLYNLGLDAHLSDYTIADCHPDWAIQVLHQEGFPTAIQQGHWLGESALATPDGREIPVSQVLVAHKSAAGEVEYFSTIMRDISDLKQSEVERERLLQELSDLNCHLAQANLKLEHYSQTLEQRVATRTAELQIAQERIIAQEKLAFLGTLTAGVAHELRNPLNFVKNYAESSLELAQELLETFQPLMANLVPHLQKQTQQLLADVQENADAICRHSNRAEKIVASMMQHAHLSCTPITSQSTDLHALLDQAIKLAFHNKQTHDPSFNPYIQTDYDSTITFVDVIGANFSRAIINLVENAYDSMLAKQEVWSRSPEVSASYVPMLLITTRSEANQVRIQIRDNGCGMSPQTQARILEPFFTTKPPGEGTGLGLSITHDIIVNQHQGQLSLESVVNEFTEFTLELPIKVTSF